MLGQSNFTADIKKRESSDPKAMAWPGPRGCRHMLIIGIGCGLDAPAEEEESAKKLAREAPKALMGGDPRILPTPNAIDEWTDIPQVCLFVLIRWQFLMLMWPFQIYGSNLHNIQELRAKYDPKARFKAHVKIA